ncbi:MAG: hypothetical protein HQK49_15585 [Oligoflexia bacterium]|nr:hypothetical protein [Oligoflexia bacterium]
MNREFIYNGKTYLVNTDFTNTTITINGRPYTVQIQKSADSNYIFSTEGKVYNTFVSVDKEGVYYVDYHGVKVKVLDKRRQSDKDDVGDSAESSVLEIKSPIPGKVVKLQAVAGAKVSKGDTLIVVEAMKMETSYKSNIDGEIEAVFASEGQQIAANKVLVKLKN